MYIKELAESRSLIEKPLYSGHFFLAPHEHFEPNLPLNNGHLMIGWEKKNHMHVFIRQISLL